MNSSPVSHWFSRVYFPLVWLLAVTGLAQMPIFKRYYVADIPGFGWLADFYFTHKLHYVAAAILLFLVFQVGTLWFVYWRHRLVLTPSGRLRICILAVVVVTGIIRMYKNQPGVSYSPFFTMLVDWAHLGFVLLLGSVALWAAVRGSRAFLRQEVKLTSRSGPQ